MVPTETGTNGIGEVEDSRTPFFFGYQPADYCWGHGDKVLLLDQQEGEEATEGGC